MTRARQPKPTAPPLAATLRAALASDWRTLAALDTLTAARGSDARRLVHEALRALRGEGCVLEERVGRGGVEVRLAPASPTLHSAADDGPGVVVLIDDLPDPFGPPPGWEPAPVEVASAAPLQPAPALDAPASPVGQAAPAPKPTGPGSRCAECNRRRDLHHPADGHPFTPKPRGRPRFRALATPETRASARRDARGGDDHQERRRAAAIEASGQDQGRGVRLPRRGREAIEPVGLTPPPETSRGESEETPSGAAQGFADTLRKAFPDAFKPEIIDGADVATVAREMVDLTIAFSPVVARRDSIDAVGVTPLDNGRFRVDALWETTGLPMEVDAAGLAVMRARYLLLRGLLTRSLSGMDHRTRSAVVHRFFRGIEPWCPAPGSPLATMGTNPITIAVPDGVGIEAIDWTALMGALAGEDGEVPAVVPVRPLGPPPPPAPPPEPPAAHALEGPHDRACGYWKLHEPARVDPAKLAAEIKLCRACWGKVYALGGGRPRVEDGRKYVGDRYV